MQSLVAISIIAASALAFGQGIDAPFQVSFAANLNTSDAAFTVSNSGASGGANLCVNTYTFGADATLVSCCSCLVKPNSSHVLSAKLDLLPRGFPGTSIVVKAISSAAAASAPFCNPTTVGTGSNTVTAGMLAWTTSLETATTTSGAVVAPSRIPFTPATLSAAELTSVTSRCAALSGGICSSCP